MPIENLENPSFISQDGAGRPNAGGTVGVYIAGTSFGTPATIWSDQVKTAELTNPVTLDSAGMKEIWYDVKVDIRETFANGSGTRDTLNLDPNATATVSTGFNLAENGSFETDSDSDGQPDSWTISPYSGSAIAITEAIVTDGVKALEFNTGAAGSGGGTATSNKFAVTEGTVCSVNWSFYATNATTLNTFQIRWYDEDDVLQSTSTLTMPASGAVPTSWTEYTEEVTADAAGTQGEIVLTGISSGGSNLSSKAYFDGIKIVNLTNMVTLAGTQTLTNKTLTTPTITTPVVTGSINDANSNEVIVLGSTASAVNEVTITNAATGNRPTISSSGEADIGIDFENDQGEELLELVATPTAVNNVRITNAITTEAATIDCSETNSDLDFPRNGTGDITVDSVPIYGMVILDTPELLLQDTTPTPDDTWVSSSTFVSTTLPDASATKAIIKMVGQTGSSTVAEVFLYIRSIASAAAISAAVQIAHGSEKDAATAQVARAIGETTVNLDSNSDFEFAYNFSAVSAAEVLNIYLIGYYV
jgi:hypothetical protein